jgi:hypothetical protein
MHLLYIKAGSKRLRLGYPRHQKGLKPSDHQSMVYGLLLLPRSLHLWMLLFDLTLGGWRPLLAPSADLLETSQRGLSGVSFVFYVALSLHDQLMICLALTCSTPSASSLMTHAPTSVVIAPQPIGDLLGLDLLHRSTPTPPRRLARQFFTMIKVQ